jgi:DTW domain-containing protein YfiP
MFIGTARMASLCLSNSELHVGVQFDGSEVLTSALSDPKKPAYVLYPSDDAIDLGTTELSGPITLIAVDGTWSQAHKMLRVNPQLAALPRITFRPRRPSQYRIRREPDAQYVSTIEAIAHVLGVLEGDAARFEPLLLPFNAMIDAQIRCRKERVGTDCRRVKSWPLHRRTVPRTLRERRRDLLCVVGEANSWPYRSPEREGRPDELLHWVARRFETGECFESILAPRSLLAPNTPFQIEVTGNELSAGESIEAFLDRWRKFVRPTDVFCSWGWYAPALFADLGGQLSEKRLDLRTMTRTLSKRKLGTMEGFVSQMGEPVAQPVGRGRAGRRLAYLTSILEWLYTPERHP